MPIEEIKQKISSILKEQGVSRASVFGSVARGEATAASDVDILVELKRPYGLVKFIRLKNSLEDALKKKLI